MKQKQIIIKYMQDQPDRKFFTYELTQKSTPYGWLGSQGDRRLRDLFKEGILLKEREGKYERYWLKESSTPPEVKKRVQIINGQPHLLFN